MAHISYEVCDRCGTRLKTVADRYGTIVPVAADAILELKYAAAGWGNGPDTPYVDFRGKLCVACFDRAKEAVGAFIAVWAEVFDQ